MSECELRVFCLFMYLVKETKVEQLEEATRLALGFHPSDTTPLTDGEVLWRWMWIVNGW